MRATSDQPQLWHLDLLLELQNVGVEHAFSCFMPMNLAGPMDGRENMFVYGSSSGVLCPWEEVSMSILAGDLWILSNYVIHRGGAVPRDAPPTSTRIVASPPLPHAALTTRQQCRSSRHPGLKPPRHNRRHLPRMRCIVQQHNATGR